MLFIAASLCLLTVFITAFSKKERGFRQIISSDTTLPSFALAKGHKGVNVVNTSGFITFSSGLDNDYYKFDSVNRTGYLYVETKMARFVNESAKKVPQNISIVLDRSGSMAGEKMEFAKKAAVDIIDKLNASDFVNVVIYNDMVEVIQPAI